MSLRKFISGVTAFAVAATAFAAMAVTASADNITYENISVTPGIFQRIKSNTGGVFTTRDNRATGTASPNYSGVIADLSNLENIDYATSVTVQFDTFVSYGSNILRKIMYGVGDKAQRSLTANAFRNHIGSYSGATNAAGLITCFGSEDGENYNVYDDVCVNQYTNTASKVYGYNVRTTVTLDRENDTYTAKIQGQKGSSRPTILDIKDQPTTVDNLTVIEAVTWGEDEFSDFTLKNILVSYTVPDNITAQAFTFTESLNSLQNLQMYVTKANGEAAQAVPVSDLKNSTNGVTVYTGTGDVNLAIVFENIPTEWGDLSVVLK